MISKRIYFTMLIMFITVFCLFMFIGISSNLVMDNPENIRATKEVRFGYDDILSSEVLNMESNNRLVNIINKNAIAIISQDEDSNVTNILIEWCVYNKHMYKVFRYLPSPDDIAGFDVIIFGDILLFKEDKDTLYSYADKGVTMFFTKLPAYQILESDIYFADFFGIKETISRSIRTDGIKIFSDFMIGGERIYQKDDYFGIENDTSINISYYKLRPGHEIYAVGLFDNHKELGIDDKDLPALLWRTKTKNSFVFAVNAGIFNDISLLGVLTGFMSHKNDIYLYPIVNAQTISMVDFPYFSEENKENIEQMYSRNSEALSRDILWPNIIQVLKNYGNSYNFFAASQLDYMDEVGPNGNYINFYLREINKLPGEMGISFGQVSERDLTDIIDMNHSFFNETIPTYDFTALFLEDFYIGEIKEKLEHDLLDSISLIMSDYNSGDKLIDFVNDYVLSVKFNLDGYQHETLDDLQMKSIYNALGMSNMKVDIKRAIFPKDSSDEWNNLSLAWSKGDTYFKDYTMFDSVSIYEMENRIRRFLALDFCYEYNNDNLDIQIQNFDEEAYFILSIYDKSIVSINKGDARKISDNTYLIKAKEPDVQIQLKEDTILESPDNNYRIPSNPEVRYSK